MEALEIENLNFTYAGQSEKALSDVSFSLRKGEFLTVCGPTGSGKSTLLRLLKPETAPKGEICGKILYDGKNELSPHESACRIGFVAQRPQQQIVTDKCYHELAFGLENLGVPTDEIRRRVAEMASYFGISEWFDRETSALSGGQMQILNLASVMVMNPEVLLLDEPTAQLDPIAASDFLTTVSRLHRDFSLTVVLVEHRLEEVLPISDKLLVFDKGIIRFFGEPRKAVSVLGTDDRFLSAMPAAVRIFSAFPSDLPCPLTVREGHDFLASTFDFTDTSLEIENTSADITPSALTCKGLRFRYSKDSPDVIRDLELDVKQGEIFAILGGNGSGKSTALSLFAGIRHPQSGKIGIFGKKISEYKNGTLYRNCLTMLPQDVQTLFSRETVREELENAGCDLSSLPFDVSATLEKHPYDLSGGQQQLAALAKVLSAKPRLLLLDEPTKGLDAELKNQFISILKTLKNDGVTVVFVTHDVEFAALCADRCAMFFRGAVTSCAKPHEFFSKNTFYTTAACRMTRGILENAVTTEEVIEICRRNRKNDFD